MKTLQLLSDLRRAGVVLAANANRLAFDAPAGVTSPTEMAILTARKAEVLAVLVRGGKGIGCHNRR